MVQSSRNQTLTPLLHVFGRYHKPIRVFPDQATPKNERTNDECRTALLEADDADAFLI